MAQLQQISKPFCPYGCNSLAWRQIGHVCIWALLYSCGRYSGVGFEKVYLLAKVELDLASSQGSEFKIDSDIPGNALALRVSVFVPVTPRRIYQHRLPYTLQGKLFRFTYQPGGGQTYLYGVRVWARELPGGAWTWYPLPVVPTPNEWSSVKLEIPNTGDWTSVKIEIPAAGEWTSAKLGIPGTPDDWNGVKLEIPETGSWTEMKLPIKPTSPVPDWITLEVDQ